MATNGSRRFAQWLARDGRTLTSVASVLGVDASYLSHLRAGRRTPGLTLAVSVERLTGIPASAWALTEEHAA